jgi:NAD(P) transhydrogenase subunit alpha
MKLGILRDTYRLEKRVAITPGSVVTLREAGFDVLVETRAGVSAGFADRLYTDAGAVVLPREEVFAQSDWLVQVRFGGANPERGEQDAALVREGQILVGLWDPLFRPQGLAPFAERGATVFALELMPRITRAQPMDVLSSMATVAGYRAVLLAAVYLPRFFPMLITAAGTIRTAKVFVIGAGVAGLQAIATARRLGAAVSAYDVRPAVKEQVESLGAWFIDLPQRITTEEDSSGYARELGEEHLRAERAMLAEVIRQSDVVICSAVIPGKPAPRLVTREMVESMRPGSVIVDLAAERGGNCELTRPGETVVHHGVTILGPVNLPAEVPEHASQMFSRNLTAFLVHLRRVAFQDGKLNPNVDDPIVRGTLVLYQGKVCNPEVAKLLRLPEPAEVFS